MMIADIKNGISNYIVLVIGYIIIHPKKMLYKKCRRFVDDWSFEIF